MSIHKYNLGVIGNCSYMAYIDMKADVKWMCMPRFDSSFIFGSLLDEKKGGHFYIQPADENYSSKQFYVPNTNVLCTEFTTAKGKFLVKDFAPRMMNFERKFRPMMLMRKIELLQGDPYIKVCCDPRGDYGRIIPEVFIASNHIRYSGFPTQLRLTTDVPLSYVVDAK